MLHNHNLWMKRSHNARRSFASFYPRTHTDRHLIRIVVHTSYTKLIHQCSNQWARTEDGMERKKLTNRNYSWDMELCISTMLYVHICVYVFILVVEVVVFHLFPKRLRRHTINNSIKAGQIVECVHAQSETMMMFIIVRTKWLQWPDGPVGTPFRPSI